MRFQRPLRNTRATDMSSENCGPGIELRRFPTSRARASCRAAFAHDPAAAAASAARRAGRMPTTPVPLTARKEIGVSGKPLPASWLATVQS